MKFILSLLFFTCLLAGSSYAQYLPNECGTPSSATDKLKSISTQNFRVLAGTRVIRIYIVVYRDNDGSNQAMPEEDVKKEILFSDSIYSIGDVCFTIVGIEFRNSTFYNNPVSSATDYSGQRTGSGEFNVFIVNTIGGGTYGWAPYVIAPYMVTKAAGFGTRRTFIHEMGHALGLEHTFKGTGHDPTPSNVGCDELVNGSNGFTCGDFVQDTPADPYERCGTAIAGCTFPYTAPACKDANNQGYNPQMNNFMSYWANYGCNRTVFTSGQYIRMQGAIDNNAILSAFLAPDNVTITNAVISTGFVKEAAKYTLTGGNIAAAGNYTVNGTAQAVYSGSSVILKPGFTASPSSGGIVRVLAGFCH